MFARLACCAGLFTLVTACGPSDATRNSAIHACNIKKLSVQLKDAKTPEEMTQLREKIIEATEFLKITNEHADKDGIPSAMKDLCPEFAE